MIKLAEKSICSGCGACASICPTNSIFMETDEEGFLYPEIKIDKCIECQKCQKACPVLEKNTYNHNISAYAVKHNNEEIRMQSSSGGFFSLLAEYVIDNNGVVFGATLDKSLCVRHICIECKEDIEKLRGSKYVQSIIGDTYIQAKNHLSEGKIVLFTGTPCQIEGLLKFLGKKYINLITQDIICHGVPSPKVWNNYIKWHEEKGNSSVISTSFRNKKYGWKHYSMNLQFDNGNEKIFPLKQDLFLRSFSSDLCLRPSCYNCCFKTKYRPSDFTLADFWGIQNIFPETDDDKGTSLVIIRSQKATDIFNFVKPLMTYKTADAETALKYNPSATQSVKLPASRKKFLQELNSKNLENIVNKYCLPPKSNFSFFKKILRKIKKTVRWSNL